MSAPHTRWHFFLMVLFHHRWFTGWFTGCILAGLLGDPTKPPGSTPGLRRLSRLTSRLTSARLCFPNSRLNLIRKTNVFSRFFLLVILAASCPPPPPPPPPMKPQLWVSLAGILLHKHVWTQGLGNVPCCTTPFHLYSQWKLNSLKPCCETPRVGIVLMCY